MKNWKKGIAIASIAFIAMIGGANAESYYINLNGVEMNELQYNKMKTMFSDRKVEHLTQEDFDQFKDVSIVSNETVYEKTTYKDGEVVSVDYISEDEYNSIPEGEVCTPYSDTDKYWETEFKRLSATIYSAGSLNILSTLNWKKVPAYKSYDVYGMRFQYFNYSNPTGQQDYYVGDAYSRINYNSSSEGYKGFNNGFGFSMNLKDGSNITSYDLGIHANISKQNVSSNSAHAYVAYEHAQANVTRAQSMSYTLDVSGLGNVFYYANVSMRNVYDGMGGLHLLVPLP